MAVSLSSLRDQVRQRADMQRSEFISDSELDLYINNSYKELYDIITSRYEDATLKLDPNTGDLPEFTLAGGDYKWDLPDDLYKLLGFDLLLDGQTNSWFSLSRWNFSERAFVQNNNLIATWARPQAQYRIMGTKAWFYPQDYASGRYRIWYIPKCEDLTLGTKAALNYQSFSFTAVDYGTAGNSITIEFTSGGTAGSEIVSVVGSDISVQIDSGVSTATQVLTALNNSAPAMALIDVSIVGSSSAAQLALAASSLVGGTEPVDMLSVLDQWSDYVVVDSAIKCLEKEESDPSVFVLQKQQLMQRIEALATNRDAGEPERISDVNRGFYGTGYGPYGGWGPGWL